MRKYLLYVLLFFNVPASAQTDTSFWFAAPDVSSAFNYDRPVLFRLSSYQSAAQVTINQPANAAFTPIVITLSPYTSQSVDLTNWINLIECAPGNVIQNKGLKITSTSKIAAYYEVNANGPNPELYALKGKNALGTQFFISSQYILDNTASHSPVPVSSFNIVSSENNNQVTITPTAAIVGHVANVPFTITLNRGQTYAAIATSTNASAHLQGSKVVSTKPVAITLNDDLLKGTAFGGICEDVAGDQTVPVDVIGTEYIAFKSNLNFPGDKVYVTATQNATTVIQNGVLVATINAGQSTELSMSTNTSYIRTSSPAYAYQLSGIGCEVGSAVLPKIICTGSSSVSITRSTNESFIITLLVRTGAHGGFRVNNDATAIPASSFAVVPFTGGVWSWAKVELPIWTYPNESVIRIENNQNVFQLGVIQGGSASGAGFGYFSDYNSFQANAFSPSPSICVGSAIQLNADTISSATYSWTGPGTFSSTSQNPVIPNATAANSGNYYLQISVPGCGVYYDTLNIQVKPKTTSVINASICQGASHSGYTTSGTYINTFIGANGCDSIRTLNLTVKPKSFSTITASICAGETYAGYTVSGTYTNTFVAANGCDSVRTLNLTVKPRSFTTLSHSMCQGQVFMGNTTAGVYLDTLTAANGCDSIITLNLTVIPRVFSTINHSICQGEVFMGYSTTGIYIDTLVGSSGCDSIRTINLIVNQRSFSTLSPAICEGQTYAGYNTSGTYIDTLIGSNGCDSIRTINLTVKPKSFSTLNPTICAGDSYAGYTISGTYTDILVAANGCDSVRTINLIVKPRSFTTLTHSMCEGQVFMGHSYSGTYIDTLTAANGCDSIRTLNLTVIARSFTTINQAICQGQVFMGHSTTGTYIDTLVAASGCDSIRTINLTVNQKTFSNYSPVICQGQSYSGYTATGTYIDTLTGTNGCDSIRTINLTVNPNSTFSISTQICQGQSYQGYSVSGVFIDTLQAANGCDSIRTINLNVLPASITNVNPVICQGENYFGYTTSGTYIDTLVAQNGCDSIRKTVLTVVKSPAPELGPGKILCSGDTLTLDPGLFLNSNYLWSNNATTTSIVVSQPGTYSVTVSNTCGTAFDQITVAGSVCDIYVPNTFTPNKDGNNDVFKVINASQLKEFQMLIYNRWGEKIFETNDPLTFWDGTIKGMAADAGHYVWYCRYKRNATGEILKGSVLLLR